MSSWYKLKEAPYSWIKTMFSWGHFQVLSFIVNVILLETREQNWRIALPCFLFMEMESSQYGSPQISTRCTKVMNIFHTFIHIKEYKKVTTILLHYLIPLYSILNLFSYLLMNQKYVLVMSFSSFVFSYIFNLVESRKKNKGITIPCFIFYL